MKNVKIIVAALLVLCMTLGLCACGGKEEPEQTTEAKTTTEQTTEAQTTVEETTEDNGMVVYTVKVVDEAGNPIANVRLQLCMESCYPSRTGEDGVAKFTIPEGEYKASLTLPDGYDYTTEEQEFHFEDGSTDMTITLKAVA